MVENWTDVAAVDALGEDETLDVEVGGRAVCLYRLPDGVFATGGICTHGEARLADGYIVDDALIECPLHEGSFDIRSGAAVGAPCTQPIKTFAVLIKDGRIHVGS